MIILVLMLFLFLACTMIAGLASVAVLLFFTFVFPYIWRSLFAALAMYLIYFFIKEIRTKSAYK